MNHTLAQGSPFDPFEKGKGGDHGKGFPVVPEPSVTGAILVGVMLVLVGVGRWRNGRKAADRWD